MSYDSVKAAMATLLTPLGFDAIYQYAEQRIPRSESKVAVIWERPQVMQERRIAGGRGGLKRRVWPVYTTLSLYGEVTHIDSVTFDALLNAVQLAYARSINLGALADVANVSKVLKFAEEMSVAILPPELDGDLNELIKYEATITAQVFEVVNV